MKTAIVTDGAYRSAVTAVRALGRAGYRVIVTEARESVKGEPPAFSSRWGEGVWIEGSRKDAAYAERLAALLARCERPVLFCVGAATLQTVAAQRQRFEKLADFLIAEPETLDALNDKKTVHDRALELGLPVPEEYAGAPDHYPVVLKPRCGEKLGLKAAQRYAIVRNEEEYRRAMQRMRALDPEPIVQELVEGPGFGASLLLDRDGRLIDAICHRRIREYPMSGGPSTCCQSIYDAEKVGQAERLLRSFGFVGLAMVEFKGDRILEVNPRVWGSFPLTAAAESEIAVRYARAAARERLSYEAESYRAGERVRFFWNDLAASCDLLCHGKWSGGLAGLGDVFRCREAMADREDPKPYHRYLRSYLKR